MAGVRGGTTGPFSIDLSPPDDVSPPRTAATCLRIHMHAKEQKQGVEGTVLALVTIKRDKRFS